MLNSAYPKSAENRTPEYRENLLLNGSRIRRRELLMLKTTALFPRGKYKHLVKKTDATAARDLKGLLKKKVLFVSGVGSALRV